MKRLSRRTILRGAGGAAIALPFLEAMLPRRAHAAAPAAPTPFRSLELGVQVGAADDWGRMIYRAANQPLPPTDDPVAVYNTVFSDLHTDPVALAHQRMRHKSILDAVSAEYARIS